VRIATWNVNSLSARLEALAHHGEGRWNGVAIASRVGLADVVTNFGEPWDFPLRGPLGPRSEPGAPGDAAPLAEARMIAATTAGVRVVSLYAPNGRTVGSPFYEAKLRWLERLVRWTQDTCDPREPLVLGGDFNVAPTDLDVWDAAACHGGTHVSEREREHIAALQAWGLRDAYRIHHPEGDRYTWWDYRAGMFYKNHGMRIDLLLVTAPLAERLAWVDIDREARKGKPTPSDHAPVAMDVAIGAESGVHEPLDTGWIGADARISARRKKTTP
jgi:exodeoxyribonuclease-3